MEIARVPESSFFGVERLVFIVRASALKTVFLLTGALLGLIGGRNAYAEDGALIIPMNWVGRSTEAPASVPFSPTPGGAVSQGLLLALDPSQVVFDNGTYTPQANKDVTPAGNEWASWRQWHGSCFDTYEVRHLRATFNLPTEVNDVSDLILFSPFYTAHGDIIPINDNVYVYLNGTFIGRKGTSYGATNLGVQGTAPFANETDGWFQNGSFGGASVSALQPGLNTVDFVAEEYCGREGSGGNGMGRLDLKLVTGQAHVVNDLVALSSLTKACSRTAVAGGPAGTCVFQARFTNTSSTPINAPFFQVTQLSGGNLLLNADGGPGGVGATLTPDVGADRVLTPGETFTTEFDIGLQAWAAFTFFVDLWGVTGP